MEERVGKNCFKTLVNVKFYQKAKFFAQARPTDNHHIYDMQSLLFELGQNVSSFVTFKVYNLQLPKHEVLFDYFQY